MGAVQSAYHDSTVEARRSRRSSTHLRLVETDADVRDTAGPLVDDDPWAGEDDPVPDAEAPEVDPRAEAQSPLAPGRAVAFGVLVSIPIWIAIGALAYVLSRAF
jgi:hypothetical protein